MKKLLPILLLFCLNGFSQTTPLTFTRLSGDFLAPGKGAEYWGGHTWNDITQPTIPAGTTFPKLYYERYNWLDIESNTVQGSYNWTNFDTRTNFAIDHGGMFHFGVMIVCNACGSGGHIPTYVANLMSAEGKPCWNDGNNWPNYQSVQMKARYAALLRAIADHIAVTSHSGVPYSKAFYGYDMRHFDEFGEGATQFHTTPNGPVPAGAQVTDTYLNAMVDSTIAIFPNVQLTVPMGYFTVTSNQYGNANGNTDVAAAYKILTATNNMGRIGWRRDNIGDDGYNVYFTGNTGSYNPGSGVVQFQPLIMNMWKFAPIGGEPSTDFNGVTRCGATNPYCDMTNEMNLFHMSYFGNGNAPGNVNNGSGATWTNLQANWRSVSAAMGYKIVLDSGNVTANPTTGGTFNIQQYWKNIGNAPVYEKKWKIIYELRKTSDQSVGWRDTSRFSMRLFLPQATDSIYTDNYLLTGVPAATYDLRMIIRDSLGYMPPFKLGINGQQGDGSYILKTNLVVTTSSTPTANAGPDQSIQLPTSSVNLTGASSSGSISSYAWTRISGPNTPTIVTPTTVTTSVTGLIQGTYIFQLAINGGSSGSLIDQVTITVNQAPNPVANAGLDQNITLPTNSVTVSGSGSTGVISSYAWTNVSGPATPAIASPSSVSTNITGLTAVGIYILRLTVSPGGSTDDIQVVVNSIPSNGVTIFTNQVPASGTVNDGQELELGLKFKSSSAGYITGIRFYKTSGNSGTHIGELYSITGTRMAQKTFTSETATGWQTVTFDAPVAILANTVYVAAYWSGSGNYVGDANYFGSALLNFSLSAISDGISQNGVYDYSASPVFPTSSPGNAPNYWVDVVFSAGTPNVIYHRKGYYIYFK